jgi:hypothetical protein
VLQFELSSLQPLGSIHSVSFAGGPDGVAEGAAADVEVQASDAVGCGGFSLSGQKFLPPFAAPLQGLTEQQPDQPSQQTWYTAGAVHSIRRSRGLAAAKPRMDAAARKTVEERIVVMGLS